MNTNLNPSILWQSKSNFMISTQILSLNKMEIELEFMVSRLSKSIEMLKGLC